MLASCRGKLCKSYLVFRDQSGLCWKCYECQQNRIPIVSGRRGGCKSGHCCDQQRTLVSCFELALQLKRSHSLRRIPPFCTGLLFYSLLALDNLQSTPEGAASQPVVLVTHINRAGTAACHGRWQPCSGAPFVSTLPRVQGFKSS